MIFPYKTPDNLRSFPRYSDDTKPIRTRKWMNDPITFHDLSNAYLHHVLSSYRPILSPFNRQGHPEPNTVLLNFIAISLILEEMYSGDFM